MMDKKHKNIKQLGYRREAFSKERKRMLRACLSAKTRSGGQS